MFSKKILYFIGAAMAGLVSCSPKGGRQPEAAVVYDTLFTLALQEQHGAYYADGGLENNVVSLDLYSENLSLNKQGRIEGTGTNLYFSDIFLPPTDSTLLVGTYLSDTTGSAFTFLPGKSFRGNFTGAYLLSITDGTLVSYRLLPAGSLEVAQAEDEEHVVIRFSEPADSRTKYHAVFKGRIN